MTVEMPLAVGYTLWRKLPAALLLTVVWGMNTVTRPLLSFAVVALHPWIGYSLSWLVLFELLIWIVEAAILAAAMRKQTPFWEALLLSLALNAASFGIGLLLPVP
ncbi:MAG: hypothetical protein JW929_05440 [Anaerolineales bacterium]|nr:hypothetical protein [Anaerolineales bacterium]